MYLYQIQLQNRRLDMLFSAKEMIQRRKSVRSLDGSSLSDNNTRFSSAIHTLIMTAGANKPMTSRLIAESVGTNASYIRKIRGYIIQHLSGDQ